MEASLVNRELYSLRSGRDCLVVVLLGFHRPRCPNLDENKVMYRFPSRMSVSLVNSMQNGIRGYRLFI